VYWLSQQSLLLQEHFPELGVWLRLIGAAAVALLQLLMCYSGPGLLLLLLLLRWRLMKGLQWMFHDLMRSMMLLLMLWVEQCQVCEVAGP
jgi:hypothetical protein